MISIKASSAPISKNSRLTNALPVSSVREGSCHCSRRNLSTAKWEWCWSPCVFRLRAKENIECRVALGAGHILEWRSCFPSMLYLDDFGCTGALSRKYLVDYPHQHFARDQSSNIIYHQLATIPTSSIMTLWRIEVQVHSSVVKVKPAGTGRPMDAISAKLAPLPPNLVADDALGSHGFMAGI